MGLGGNPGLTRSPAPWLLDVSGLKCLCLRKAAAHQLGDINQSCHFLALQFPHLYSEGFERMIPKITFSSKMLQCSRSQTRGTRHNHLTCLIQHIAGPHSPSYWSRSDSARKFAFLTGSQLLLSFLFGNHILRTIVLVYDAWLGFGDLPGYLIYGVRMWCEKGSFAQGMSEVLLSEFPQPFDIASTIRQTTFEHQSLK